MAEHFEIARAALLVISFIVCAGIYSSMLSQLVMSSARAVLPGSAPSWRNRSRNTSATALSY
jgi:hypothetical protein